MSVPDQGGITLEWGLHALMSSHHLGAPVYPCPEDWEEPHILGPGVPMTSSELSLAWCWSPIDEEDLEDADLTRVLSFVGKYSSFRDDRI